MKYLQDRNQFLNKEIDIKSSDIPKYIAGSRMIKETFQNDSTWGGSLLGRFINSIIRRSTIYYKATNIPRLLRQLESELLGLVTDASVDKEDEKEIESIKARFLIEKVYNIVISDDDIDKKLTQLIGDGENDDQGVLNETINEVEKLEESNFPKKEELLKKLKEFRDLLRDEEFETFTEEDEDEDEGDETSDKDDEKSGDDSKLDDTQQKFLEQSIKFFKSIMELSKVIESKIVEIEVSKKQIDIKVGKEYLFTDKKGETKPVKVISLEKSTGKQGGSLGKEKVFVAFKNKVSGNYASRIGVSKSQLSELSSASLRDNYSYRDEYLPILEDNLIRSSETEAIAVWKKILKSYSDSGMSKAFMNIQKIVEKKSGLSEKEIISLISNVILNENTIGKPIPFENLIKEDYNLVDPKYNSIPKSVSLFIKVITPLKEDKGLIGTFGAASQPIKELIESYTALKSMYPELPKLKSKKKEEGDKKEDNKKSQETSDSKTKQRDVKSRFDQSVTRRIVKESLIKDFNKFRLFEAVDKDLDEVTSAWFGIFKEGEEKEYSIDEKRAKELQERIENKTDEPFAIKEVYYDRIIKIVNIFGRAFKNYATDMIPSGRPEGRISLTTFREYKYIGSGTQPSWGAESNPGAGPWAAKFVFNKWEDGVMGILEKPELRKVLANARFLPKDVQALGSGETEKERSDTASSAKIVRAGRSLFDFINDLLAGEGEFMKIRRTVLKEYFGGADKFKDEKLEEELNNPSKLKSKKEDMASENEVGFFDYADGGFKRNKRMSVSDFAKGKKYSKEFFRIRFQEGGNKRFMIGQFFTVKNDTLILKFQLSKDGKEQSIISTYLSKDIKDKDWQLEGLTIKPNPLYIGVVDSDVITKGDFKFKTVNIDTKNTYNKDSILKREITILNIEILGHNVDGKLTSIKKENPDNDLPKDINFDNIKTEDFTK